MTFTFSHLVTRFFSSYLAGERGLSDNTIASYSDCMRLLINYTCTRFAVECEDLGIEMISCDLILDFLDHLERDRENRAETRNQRLAAIKAFFHFLALHVPELMELNERVQHICPKKTEPSPPPSMSLQEVEAIIDSPDPTRMLGARDKALLQTFYNTGARVQEIADLTIADLHLCTPITVTLTGKGGKRRTVPLWPETVTLIQHYLQLRQEAGIRSDLLFLNCRGSPMTRFGIGRRVHKHADAAAKRPGVSWHHPITPHVFRHTTALHLIEAHNDITIAKEWLGHADLKTTSQYVEVSIERKRAALERFPPPGSTAQPEPAAWRQPPLMEFLCRLSRKAGYVASIPPVTLTPSRAGAGPAT